jgi:hypothetical protein
MELRVKWWNSCVTLQKPQPSIPGTVSCVSETISRFQPCSYDIFGRTEEDATVTGWLCDIIICMNVLQWICITQMPVTTRHHTQRMHLVIYLFQHYNNSLFTVSYSSLPENNWKLGIKFSYHQNARILKSLQTTHLTFSRRFISFRLWIIQIHDVKI